MRRLSSIFLERAAGHGALSMAALLVAGFLSMAAPAAMATPANFDPVFGFESDGLEGLPILTMVLDDGFFSVGELGLEQPGQDPYDVSVVGSMNLCILPLSSDVCQADLTGIDDAYSVIVSLTVDSTNDPAFQTGPFTVFLSGVGPSSEYTSSEFFIELEPTAPSTLDTSVLDDFAFDGTFTPFIHVVDESYAPGTIYDYIGWTVQVGDTVSFRYEASAPDGRVETPQLSANAIPSVIPEPGTALLMALGLAGLAAGQRRLNPELD